MSAMTVRRVETGSGSRVEPPLDQSWDDLTKLRWKAGLVEHETGLRITVYGDALSVRRPGRLMRALFGEWIAIPGSYGVSVGSASIGSFDFHGAWTLLNGVNVGARQGERQAER